MSNSSNDDIRKIKAEFKDSLRKYVNSLNDHIAEEDGQWKVKGFIDTLKNIYTISADTKIVSKILEIHLFPQILEFADKNGYSILLAEHQNWYPDISFINKKDNKIIFAVDLKTTYRDPDYPGHVNGFTLGSHGTYFKDRTSTKNIQFPYSKYSGHFCLGVIYSRVGAGDIDETEIIQVRELKDKETTTHLIGNRQVTTVDNLKSIISVIKDFQFFLCEKWELASDRQGSHNTANIGSITSIEDILKGNGIFAKLGEEWFDEYWINYGKVSIVKDGKSKPITCLKDYLDFKGIDKKLIVKIKTKRKGESEGI